MDGCFTTCTLCITGVMRFEAIRLLGTAAGFAGCRGAGH